EPLLVLPLARIERPAHGERRDESTEEDRRAPGGRPGREPRRAQRQPDRREVGVAIREQPGRGRDESEGQEGREKEDEPSERGAELKEPEGERGGEGKDQCERGGPGPVAGEGANEVRPFHSQAAGEECAPEGRHIADPVGERPPLEESTARREADRRA